MNPDEQLRWEAEQRLKPERANPAQSSGQSAKGTQPLSPEEHLRQQLLIQEHELHVHQIELEIQNEELRRATAELEQAHDRYADLFEFAPVGYVVFDVAGIIQQVNLAGCKQLGAVRQQLLGRRLSLFVNADQRVRFAALLARVFLNAEVLEGGWGSGAQQRGEFLMLRQDNVTWDAQIECAALPGGVRPLARAVLTDVSELKGVQREVEQLNHTLEQQVERRTLQTRQLNEELQTFVYSITHDMTRPLRQVQGFSELLAQSMQTQSAQTKGAEPLDERSARYLEHLRTAARHMSAQMNSLMAFFQSSQPLNHHQRVDLNRVIEAVMQDLSAETCGRQITLTVEPLPTLEADRVSLQTVFSNLLANAVKFTRPRATALIHVGVEERGDTYLFHVRDNGVGFEPQRSGRMFGVFQRMHSERDFEGQGMGLALVRRIVQRYQGRVWAESVPGQGSVFWVQLPKVPVAVLDEASW